MDFRTKVELPKGEAEIRHQDKIMLLGSCFAENIGRRLVENKFQCDINPFGILYNPYSINIALEEIMKGKVYQRRNLFEADGMWHSWMHHSSFSAPTMKECLANINARIAKAHEWLKEADWLIITWGTANYYFFFMKNNITKIVANCHKQPDSLFLRGSMYTECFHTTFSELIRKLEEFNPKLKMLLTVSPIRHTRDGMHGNQVSKARLLVAADEFAHKTWGYEGVYYFPAYEIMNDELRDYRFYADDMIHPSALAQDYIWECFSECYFPTETKQVIKEWEEIKRGLAHRPFDASSEAYRKFLTQIVLKIERMKEKLPYLDVQNELELCHTRLNR